MNNYEIDCSHIEWEFKIEDLNWNELVNKLSPETITLVKEAKTKVSQILISASTDRAMKPNGTFIWEERWSKEIGVMKVPWNNEQAKKAHENLVVRKKLDQ